MERKHMSAFALYQTISTDIPPPAKKASLQVNLKEIISDGHSSRRRLCSALFTPPKPGSNLYVVGAWQEEEEKGEWDQQGQHT